MNSACSWGTWQEPLRTSQGRAALGVYREKRQEVELGWREQERRLARQACRQEPHTWVAHVGKPKSAMQAREGDAIPMGTGHPVRPALVTPAPLSLL